MVRSLLPVAYVPYKVKVPSRTRLFLYGFAGWVVIGTYILLSFHRATYRTRSSNTDAHDLDDKELLTHQLQMLSVQQMDRYESITSGTITKKQVEIVLSRHDEDISWSDMYAELRTVYDKPSNTTVALQPTSTRGSIVPLANLGRESYTYLWHIVHNYDRLAQLTVFSHGSVPQHGYRGHRRGGGHLLANSTFHDFVLTTSPHGHFIFTGAVWLPTLAHVLRSGYNKEGATRQQALSSCPNPLLTDEGGSEYQFDLDDKPHLHLLQHIASLCQHENSTTCTGIAFWHAFIRLPLPPALTVFFSQGAVFAVTANQLRTRPLSDYQALLEHVSHSADPSAGFFLEWLWYYLLTSDLTPCPINGREFSWAKVRPYYKALPLQERVEYTNEIVKQLSMKKKRKHTATSPMIRSWQQRLLWLFQF